MPRYCTKRHGTRRREHDVCAQGPAISQLWKSVKAERPPGAQGHRVFKELETTRSFPLPGRCGQTGRKPLGARWGCVRGDTPKVFPGTLRGCWDDDSELQGRKWFLTRSNRDPRGPLPVSGHILVVTGVCMGAWVLLAPTGWTPGTLLNN